MKRSLSLLCLAVSLGGCSGNALYDRPAGLRYVGDLKTSREYEEEALRKFNAADDQARGNLSPLAYRNSVLLREIGADEDDFQRFVQKLRTQRTAWNIGNDAAVITLNGVSAVTGGAHTKAVLSAISGGLVGLRGSVDKELFDLEAQSAIIARVRAARLAALVPIRGGMTKSARDYPLEQGLYDVRLLVNAGTLAGGVEAVQQDAGAKAVVAQAEIGAITRGIVYRDSLVTKQAIDARLVKLTDLQVMAMVFAMERHARERSAAMQADLSAINPTGSRFKDAAKARAFLRYWLDQEGGAPAELKDWTDELDLAEKG